MTVAEANKKLKPWNQYPEWAEEDNEHPCSKFERLAWVYSDQNAYFAGYDGYSGTRNIYREAAQQFTGALLHEAVRDKTITAEQADLIRQKLSVKSFGLDIDLSKSFDDVISEQVTAKVKELEE